MSNKKYSLLALLLFWFVAFAFYFKTRGAGFVTDQIGWLQSYESLGWKGICVAFGDKSLHYVYHIFGFLIWKLFGFNGTGWMLIFVSVHTAVAWVAYLVCRKLFVKGGIPSGSLVAFVGAGLFITSPYQTEPLVWYACIHYLACSLLLLLAFNFLLDYLQQQLKKFVIGFYVCFIFALFTLEISFSFPIILLVFFLFWPQEIFKNINRVQAVKLFTLPSFSLLVLYFLLSAILRGSIVGHYGATQHLNFDVPLLMGNLSKYISKVFFLTQFISYDGRQTLYSVFEKAEFGWSLFALLIIGAASFICFYKKLNDKFRILLLMFAFFVIALLPILNLYFYYVLNVEGDRFTYFASIFAYQFFALGSILLFRKFGWVLVAGFLFFNVKFLLVNTESWSDSRKIQNSLIEKFKWQEAKEIYLLNMPDNYRGTYMFRSFTPDNSFAETYYLRRGGNIESKTIEILEYNMSSSSDSVRVERISENELKVSFAQGGNWWWRKGLGASNYSTKEFEVKVDEWNYSYNLIFKKKPMGAVYLYQCGAEWREVKNF